MAQNLAAGSGVLTNAANVVANHRQQQQSIITGVESTVQTLAPGWKGSGGTAFATAANQWIQDAKNIVAVLTGSSPLCAGPRAPTRAPRRTWPPGRRRSAAPRRAITA